MVVLILAAGYATRLYPYTVNTPKPMLTVGNKRIIDYIMEKALQVPGVNKTLVVTNNRFYEQFEEWRKAQKGRVADMIKILNDGTNSVDERLGAIGDIRFALLSENIDEDLLVIAGDNLFTYDLNEQHEYFRKTGGECICVKEIEDAEAIKNLGVCEIDKNGRVIGFEEKPDNPKSNIGVFATYFFRRESLSLIDEFLSDCDKKDAPGYFIEWLYKKTDVYAYFINGECYDIGTVEAYEHISRNFEFL